MTGKFYLFGTPKKKKKSMKKQKTYFVLYFWRKVRGNTNDLLCICLGWTKQHKHADGGKAQKMYFDCIVQTPELSSRLQYLFLFLSFLLHTQFSEFCYFSQSFMLGPFPYGWKGTETKTYKCIKTVFWWVQFYLSFSFHSFFCSFLLCSPRVRANFTI